MNEPAPRSRRETFPHNRLHARNKVAHEIATLATMSKLLKVLGSLFLILLVVVGIGAAILIPRAYSLNKDAVAYIETNVPPIVETWNADELIKRAAPELLTPQVRKQMPSLFAWFASLGKLKKLGKPVGRVYSGVHTGSRGNGTWGEYAVHADFEAGPAEITIALTRVGDAWKILGFHVNSPVFLPSHS